MGVRPPSDSTDRVVQTFLVIYITTGSMFTWLIGFLSIWFLYQVLSGLYVRFSMFFRTSGLDYLESIHIFTHTAQYTFSYINRSLSLVIHILYIC